MVIAVASGKGGTGKTTVAVALAMSYDKELVLIDADVEEPNAALFLGNTRLSYEDVKIQIPVINEGLCNACGECARICRFNAIATLKTSAMVFSELCHSCGGCSLICPTLAITQKPMLIGHIGKAKCGNIDFIEGRLDIGRVSTPYMIRTVKKNIDERLTIIDCPPGTSCPMISAVTNADYIILVTEPTPFGLNDLAIAVMTIRQLNIPMGIIINKYKDDNHLIDDYCNKQDIPVIGRILEDIAIAKAYSEGQPLINAIPELKDYFNSILANIIDKGVAQ